MIQLLPRLRWPRLRAATMHAPVNGVASRGGACGRATCRRHIGRRIGSKVGHKHSDLHLSGATLAAHQAHQARWRRCGVLRAGRLSCPSAGALDSCQSLPHSQDKCVRTVEPSCISILVESGFGSEEVNLPTHATPLAERAGMANSSESAAHVFCWVVQMTLLERCHSRNRDTFAVMPYPPSRATALEPF